MIASKSRGPYFTPAEYLQLEQASDIKHEYRQGLVFAMSGAKKAHVVITSNVSGLLFSHLRQQRNCVVYSTDIKVCFSADSIYYYPDVVVTCDERDQADNTTFIRHPKLIIEVLSNSTEAFDRGEKFEDYKAIPELEEYVLIHQKQMLVERFWKRSPSLWVAQSYQPGEQVQFTSVGFSCPIEFLYEKAEQFLEVQP
ncbi:MAG: Uma2 family endonuclease [Cyanobacteria bacterium J06614_10]